jgi:hypothetical protein
MAVSCLTWLSLSSSDIQAADGQTYQLTPDIIKIERKVFKESSTLWFDGLRNMTNADPF